MFTPTRDAASTTLDQDEITERGLRICESKLKALLEPEKNGQVVAIHLDSEDFEVAPSSGAAMRAMRKRRATGPLLLHTIGPVTDTGLAARMRGFRILAVEP
jgi:hypothetical protein